MIERRTNKRVIDFYKEYDKSPQAEEAEVIGESVYLGNRIVADYTWSDRFGLGNVPLFNFHTSYPGWKEPNDRQNFCVSDVIHKFTFTIPNEKVIKVDESLVVAMIGPHNLINNLDSDNVYLDTTYDYTIVGKNLLVEVILQGFTPKMYVWDYVDHKWYCARKS